MLRRIATSLLTIAFVAGTGLALAGCEENKHTVVQQKETVEKSEPEEVIE
jgi:hypothetical protein